MNLENLNLLELNAQEKQKIVGGSYGWLWQAAVATFLYNVVADWEDNIKSFNRGMEAAKTH